MSGKNYKVIGIGAKARVGKDTLATMLKSLIEGDGGYCKIFRLADALKKDCEAFLMEKCGLNVWSQDSIEKEQFRDMLVWYGKIKRSQTAGQYWTDIVYKQIKEDFSKIENKVANPYYIIPDIRYAEFVGTDEIFWLKNKMNGIFVFLDRLHQGKLLGPANADEEINSEKIKNFADYHIVWPDLAGTKLNCEPAEEAKSLYKKIKKSNL